MFQDLRKNKLPKIICILLQSLGLYPPQRNASEFQIVQTDENFKPIAKKKHFSSITFCSKHMYSIMPNPGIAFGKGHWQRYGGHWSTLKSMCCKKNTHLN